MVRSVLFCASTLALTAAQSIEKIPFSAEGWRCYNLGQTYSEGYGCGSTVFAAGPPYPNCEDIPGSLQDKDPCMLVVRHDADQAPAATTLLGADDQIDLAGTLSAAEGFSWSSSGRLLEALRDVSAIETSVNFLLHSKIDLTTELLSGREQPLTGMVEDILKLSPERFLSSYGHSFVSGLSKGGSYFAHIPLEAENGGATSDSMDAWADVANPFGESGSAEYQEFFDNGGHNNYDYTHAGHAGSVRYFAGNASSFPYGVFVGEHPQLVLDHYDEWRGSLNDNNARTQDVLLTPYIELLQVRQILVEHHPDKLHLFMPTVAPETLKQFQACRAYLDRVQSSARAADSWRCFQSEELREAKDRIDRIANDARSYQFRLYELQESDLKDLQESGSASEFFSYGEELLGEFQAIYQDSLSIPCRV